MKRIPSLDGLRAFSILLVMVGHFAYSLKFNSQLTDTYAHAGVLIFFVISGYLITKLILKEIHSTGILSLKNFYLRRAWRIIPVAYLYLFFVTVFSHFSVREHVLSWGYLTSYASLWGALPWNLSHLWSLSVEEQFYLIWPILVSLGFGRRAAWGAIFIAPLSRYFFAHHGMPGMEAFSFPSVFDSIAAGCLLAHYEGKLEPKPYWSLAWPIALVLPILSHAGKHHGLFHLPQILGHGSWSIFNLTVALGALWAIRAKPWVLNSRLMVWIGKLSYSLYLWGMVLTNPSIHLNLGLRIAGTLGLACASYYLVEQPILRLRNIIAGWKGTLQVRPASSSTDGAA